MLLGEEVCIPMPWGNIAGKIWGVKSGYPVICLHGHNDNAASFDFLLPHLINESRCFLAVDLPGHGKSSYYPMYCQSIVRIDMEVLFTSLLSILETELVSFLEYLVDLKRICIYFDWSQIDIIAHSVRIQLSLYFASIFPELVRKLVILDLTVGEVLFELQHIYDVTVHEVNSLVRSANGMSNNHLYSEEEALHKFIEGRITLIKDDFALPIFKRGIRKCYDKVYFSNDRRNIKFLTPLITSQFHLALISKIRCPVLIILSNISNIYLEKAKTSFITLKALYNALGKHLTVKQTNFSHDMHIEHPLEVASIISNYMLDITLKL